MLVCGTLLQLSSQVILTSQRYILLYRFGVAVTEYIFLRYYEHLNDKTTIDFFMQLHAFLFLVKRGTPTDDELEGLGYMIAEKWKKLGRRLRVSDPMLQEIDQAHAELSEKGYYMLKHWKETGSAATYKVLSDALKREFVKRQDLAEKYCYINGNHFHDI